MFNRAVARPSKTLFSQTWQPADSPVNKPGCTLYAGDVGDAGDYVDAGDGDADDVSDVGDA